MADLNPYATPESPLTTGSPTQAGLLTEPRKVSAGRGWGWIADGFGLFKLDPWIWIVNVMILFAIQFSLDLIGLVGTIIFGIFYSVFQGGLIYSCYVQDTGNCLKVEHLFAGFKNNFGSLLGITALSILGGTIIGVVTLLLVFLLGGTQTVTELSPQTANQLSTGVMFAALIGLTLFTLLIMATWFAPALVMLHPLKAIEAMKLSFRGCLRNTLPFLIYGLIALPLLVIMIMVIGLAIMGLSFFIDLGQTELLSNIIVIMILSAFFPTLFASIYISYKDIFVKST